MRITPRHSPGNLITYKNKPGVIIAVTRQAGWMDRLEVLFTDGQIDWFWAEDVSLRSHLR